jgi:hypothetical protein
MQFTLNEDQSALLSGLSRITDGFREAPPGENRTASYYAHDLDRALETSGYLRCAEFEGFGALEAALVVQHIARLPVVVEAGASALIAPALGASDLPRPFAVLSGPMTQPQRLLTVARSALWANDEGVFAAPVQEIEQVDTILGYPYGRFSQAIAKGQAIRLGGPEAVRLFRRRQSLALAAEISGALTSAVAFTVDYVKQREVFGAPIGAHQAVQHRLAQCHQAARALEYLTCRAAWLDDDLQAAHALTFAQMNIPKAIFDLHQFNGAMGITYEHRLHCWTYRLRALQSDMGGANAQALAVAAALWESPSARAPEPAS